ncbi:Maf family protein [Gammaproteobacteria bacterium]|nr:Maf family protein [Gammaproteobacteria bacterium]
MLLLASASQRRTELLDLIGINHKVVDQNFDEDSVVEKDPVLCSKLIVEGKNKSARALVLKSSDKNFPVLTADTLVFTPSKNIVGKPENHEHSRELLREFSGATHSVFSTVMVSTTEQSILKTCETKVSFKNMTEQEIEAYVLSEEGVGKAGAYGIHGPAGKYVTNIEGSYTNVVGLPVHETYEILKELNIL